MAASPSVVTSDVERWIAENEFSTISKEFERVDDDSPTEHEVVDVSSEGEPVQERVHAFAVFIARAQCVGDRVVYGAIA